MLRMQFDRRPSVCVCGYASYKSGEVGFSRHRSGRVAVQGTMLCGSAWLCPVCAPHETSARVGRVQKVTEAVISQGGTAVMVTLTVRHNRSDRLQDLKDLVLESSRSARMGRAWVGIVKDLGIAGVMQAPEVTFGDHGWHFHVHCLIACKSASLADAEKAGQFLVTRFSEEVCKRGGSLSRLGQDVQIARDADDAANYVAKGLALEIAGRTGKISRSAKGETPFQIAERAMADDTKAFALWCEFAEVMPGTRSCVVTASLSRALGLDNEDDDAGEPADEPAPEAELVGTLDKETWDAVHFRRQSWVLIRKVELREDWPSIVRWARGVAGQLFNPRIGETRRVDVERYRR